MKDHEYRWSYNNYSKHWTSFGRFMYNLCYKWGMWLDKHRWLSYVLSVTWGCTTFIVGCLISLFMLIIGKKPHKHNGLWYFEFGSYWGGFEMGLIFVRDTTSYGINNHEWGHGFCQTTLLGPFMWFLVSIPSCTRYWIREFVFNKNQKILEGKRKGKVKQLPKYDDIWFEALATDIGDDIDYNRRNSKNLSVEAKN